MTAVRGGRCYSSGSERGTKKADADAMHNGFSWVPKVGSVALLEARMRRVSIFEGLGLELGSEAGCRSGVWVECKLQWCDGERRRP